MDRARRAIVDRDLVRAAFDHLTADAFMALPFESLGPTKALLKRFFSSDAWDSADDEALADAVGPGEGHWRRDLDDDLSLVYGWDDGRFALRAEGTPVVGDPRTAEARIVVVGTGERDLDPLAASFDGPVVPEATPNPRTIRFQVGTIHAGPSRWYESAGGAGDDAAARRLFTEFTEVANVLVGPDFVAVGLRRPDQWERLLLPVLATVTEEFATADNGRDDGAPRVMGGPAGPGAAVVGRRREAATETAASGPRLNRLEQAWQDLGSLRSSEPADLDRVRSAASDAESAHRQVAASLLREADPDVAREEWARLVGDPVRAVRRATADAMVDVDREDLRPLLEGALDDPDAWVRWKVLRGLVQIGAGPSRQAITGCSDDTDFRVRLEAASAVRSIG